MPCHDRGEPLEGGIVVISGVVDNRVTINIVDGIADVRMNRADKRNALDNAMFTSLAAAQRHSRSGVVGRGRFLLRWARLWIFSSDGWWAKV